MPNALFEPSPPVSADDTANHVGANAKYVTELSLIISALWIYAANFAHVGLRKSGIVVRLAAWRDQNKASIRRTAQQFGVSEATVKRYCAAAS